MALAPLTVLVGENGSGTSTLVEGIAHAWQDSLTAHVQPWGRKPFDEDAALSRDLEPRGARPRPRGGIWLRGEAMHERFSAIAADAFELRACEGVPLNARSHGEGLLAFLGSRTTERGPARLHPVVAPGAHAGCVLGHSHALSGLAAGAVTLPWAPVQGPVGQTAWVAAAGGFAMLPDLDQRGSTISRMWGPASDVPSGVVGAVARGHRWGTHDAVLAPLLFGFLASLAADWFWSSLLLLALSIGLALRALHFVIPGRAENTVIGNLVLSWGGAWLLLAYGPSPGWLPYAVMLGVLAHIAGDALTCEGVPVPLLWVVTRSRIKISPLRTGTVLETAVLVPAFLTIAIVFAYLNTPAHDAVDPLLDKLASLG